MNLLLLQKHQQVDKIQKQELEVWALSLPF